MLFFISTQMLNWVIFSSYFHSLKKIGFIVFLFQKAAFFRCRIFYQYYVSITLSWCGDSSDKGRIPLRQLCGPHFFNFFRIFSHKCICIAFLQISPHFPHNLFLFSFIFLPKSIFFFDSGELCGPSFSQYFHIMPYNLIFPHTYTYFGIFLNIFRFFYPT